MPDGAARLVEIGEPDDPRIRPYHALRGDGGEGDDRFFLCEGITLVERLLASRCEVESLMVTRRRVARIPCGVPEEVPVYVIPDSLLPDVAGRGYKNGVYARARRLFLPEAWRREGPDGPALLLGLPRLTMPGNAGAVLRSAAALGADGAILGPECADPFHHHAVRASMGAVFVLPMVRTIDFVGELLRLKQVGFRVAAAVLDADARPLQQFAPPVDAGNRYLLLLGNEYDGLAPDLLPLCDYRLVLPMANGMDSLNVAMAATLFLYEFTRIRDAASH
ncbi:MAG: RNA methyltransferase [Magnetococcales bacterium]|nr:RNA methyltransferase [Magnetococcales bacterium]